jgi:hypothetical protein
MPQADAAPALTGEHLRLLDAFVVDYAVGLLFGSRALYGGLRAPVTPDIERPVDLELLVLTYPRDGEPLHQAAIARELKTSASAISRSVGRLGAAQPPLVEVEERHGAKIVRASEAGRGAVTQFFAPMLPLKLLRREKRDHNVRLAAEVSASLTARLAAIASPEKALTWLRTKNRALKGKRPLDVIVEGDVAVVEQLVTALEEQHARTVASDAPRVPSRRNPSRRDQPGSADKLDRPARSAQPSTRSARRRRATSRPSKQPTRV